MNYFNVTQLQRMKDEFPPEVKGKNDTIVLKEITSREHQSLAAKDIASYAIKNEKIVFKGIENNSANFYVSFGCIDLNKQPSAEEFSTVIEDLEEELSNAFGYKTAVIIMAESFEKEPDVIPPLYFGELEKHTIYEMYIKIYFEKTL